MGSVKVLGRSAPGSAWDQVVFWLHPKTTADFQVCWAWILSPLFVASSVFSVQVPSSFMLYNLLYSILLWYYLLKNVFLMCFIARFINKLLKNVPAASDHLININKAIPDEPSLGVLEHANASYLQRVCAGS